MSAKPQVLFVHTNYPAQFRFLVKAFLALGWEVWFASHTYKHTPLPEVKCISLEKSEKKGSKLNQHQQTSLLAFYNLLSAKRKKGLRPIFTYVHTGWGLGQFIKDLFPKTKMIAYSEWWFDLNSEDFRFDLTNKNVQHTQYSKLMMVLRNQSFAMELQQADFIVSPTEWQKKQLPKIFREQCNVIFDGIDTRMFSPGPAESILGTNFDTLLGNKPLLTYATRGLEPYRGFPEFVSAAEHLLKSDPDWQIAIAGFDRVNYHQNPSSSKIQFGKIAQEKFKALGFQDRVHFVGSLPLVKYRNLLRRSNLHCYFTRPYVLSWSLLESALVGCKLFSSCTQPVAEFLKSDSGATLIDHTSKDLGSMLLDCASNSKIKKIDQDIARRKERHELEDFAENSKCVNRHFKLLGIGQ